MRGKKVSTGVVKRSEMYLGEV